MDKISENLDDYFKIVSPNQSDSLIAALMKDTKPALQPILDAMNRGIKSGKIKLVICTASSFSIMIKKLISIPFYFISVIPYFRDIVNKLYEEEESKSIMGVFIPKYNKVFVVVNYETLQYKHQTKENRVLLTLMHELTHYFFHNYNSEAISLFESRLLKFYTNLFRNIALDVKYPNDDKTLSISTELAKTFLSHGLSFEKDPNYSDYIEKCYKSMTAIDKTISNAWLFILTDFMENYVNSQYAKYINVLIYDTYSDSGYPTSWFSSFFYQELIFPSEVICMLSSHMIEDADFKKMLNMIFN